MTLRHVMWEAAWRIVASRYPPINLFERLTADTAIWDALIAAEEMTNPRLRQETGEISLVPPTERVSGAGASYVMAAFTHLNPQGSRFSDGSYGVYYAAAEIETAIKETVFHFEKHARDSCDPPRMEDMRVTVGKIAADFEDVGTFKPQLQSAVLDPHSYAAARNYGRTLRNNGANGIVYPSVRRNGGECIGAFKPKAVGLPHQERHLKYDWNGVRVIRYFDYSHDEWIML